MYFDFYSEDPDYFGQQDVQPRNTSSYYYDGRGNLYQGGYGKIISGQDPCYYANMRKQQRAQNPFMNPESRRYMNESQVQPAPMPGTYGDPNYFNQEPAYYGYGSRDPQYFGYSYQDPNTRRYGNTPYTPQAYQAYQSKPAPVAPQPQGGLNTNLFAQQRGYSNPINQSMPQQVPQRQLLRVSCPQQTNGFGPNKYNTPKLPSDPNIDWAALSGIDAMNNPVYPANNGYAYGQGRTIPLPPQSEQSWYDIARHNFGR